MRYHWGLGVGHVYAYQGKLNADAEAHNNAPEAISHNDEDTPLREQQNEAVGGSGSPPPSDDDDSDDGGSDSNECETDEGELDEGQSDSDQEMLAMDDMYGE